MAVKVRVNKLLKQPVDLEREGVVVVRNLLGQVTQVEQQSKGVSVAVFHIRPLDSFGGYRYKP
jgi:hypothetical protein